MRRNLQPQETEWVKEIGDIRLFRQLLLDEGGFASGTRPKRKKRFPIWLYGMNMCKTGNRKGEKLFIYLCHRVYKIIMLSDSYFRSVLKSRLKMIFIKLACVLRTQCVFMLKLQINHGF